MSINFSVLVMLHLAALVGGLLLLAVSADVFVVGAARLATAMRLPPVVVGTVVIGFGTSLPELVSSVLASAQGSLSLAIGSVIGSDTANATLVVGVTGILAAPAVSRRVLRREAPMAAAAVALFALAARSGMSRWSGIGLLVAMAIAAVLLLVQSREEPQVPLHDETGPGDGAKSPGAPAAALRAAGGLVGTLAGAELLVWGALGVAAQSGLPIGPVGIVVVGLGTSLPELVTAVQACRRGHTDLVVGNVLGSNMLNSLGVAGVAAVVHPQRLPPSTTGLPLLVTVLAMATVSLFFVTGRRLRRGEGILLVVLYGASVAIALR